MSIVINFCKLWLLWSSFSPVRAHKSHTCKHIVYIIYSRGLTHRLSHTNTCIRAAHISFDWHFCVCVHGKCVKPIRKKNLYVVALRYYYYNCCCCCCWILYFHRVAITVQLFVSRVCVCVFVYSCLWPVISFVCTTGRSTCRHWEALQFQFQFQFSINIVVSIIAPVRLIHKKLFYTFLFALCLVCLLLLRSSSIEKKNGQLQSKFLVTNRENEGANDAFCDLSFEAVKIPYLVMDIGLENQNKFCWLMRNTYSAERS